MARLSDQNWNEDIKDSGDISVDKEVRELIENKETAKAVELYCYKLQDQILQAYSSNRTPVVNGKGKKLFVGQLSWKWLDIKAYHIFTQMFRKLYRMTPQEYRKHYRNSSG